MSIERCFKTLPVDMPPSHFCAVCGKLERDNAVTCTSAFWLCNKCLGKLKKVVEEVEYEHTNPGHGDAEELP